MALSLDYQEQANELYKGAGLAPMVRASTTPLRTLALSYGADFVYSEELIDRSLSATIRQENTEMGTIDFVKDLSTLSKKTQRKLAKEDRPCLLLRIDPKVERNKLICQLGTGEPALALPAALHVYKDVASIDINMGCPKKFSVSGGMGSALLDDPDRAARLLKMLRQEIPRPISCKIRLLKNTADTVHFVEGMINAGANAVAIHARRVGHDATFPADWATLKEVLGLLRPKYPDFPFLVNGDFYDRQECQDVMETTKANGVLLARPALYNTSIFRKLPLEMYDKTKVVQDYLQRAVRYDVHYKNAKYVICEMMNNRRAPTQRVPRLPQVFPGGQTIAKTCQSSDMKQMCQVWNVEWSSAQHQGQSEPLAAGEHRYEDSYFLKREPNGEGQEESQAKKRIKTDASSFKDESDDKPTMMNGSILQKVVEEENGSKDVKDTSTRDDQSTNHAEENIQQKQ
jgi:tRNA-dihydrouridine synthase 2